MILIVLTIPTVRTILIILTTHITIRIVVILILTPTLILILILGRILILTHTLILTIIIDFELTSKLSRITELPLRLKLRKIRRITSLALIPLVKSLVLIITTLIITTTIQIITNRITTSRSIITIITIACLNVLAHLILSSAEKT